MKQSQRVAKNFFFGGLGTALSLLLQFASVVVIARSLPVDQFGVYTLLIAFLTVLQQCGELGMSSILIRDLAIDPARIAELFGNSLSLQWLISGVIMVLLCAALPLLHLTREVATATVVMALAGLWCVRTNLYGALFRSQEDNELHAAGFVLYGAAQLVLVLAVAKFWPTLVGVSCTYLIANMLQVAQYQSLARRRYARPTLRPSLRLWKYLLVNSVPLGVTAITRTLGEQSDFVILAWLTDLRSVGLYSGPYKLVVGLRYAAHPIVFALFPLYSRAAGGLGSRQGFGEMYERSIRAFLAMAFPLAALFLISPRLLTVGLLGARYAQGAAVMTLLSVAAFMFVLEAPFPALLTSLGEQRFLMITSIVSVASRVTINLAATPWLGIRGPCVAVGLSELGMVALWIGRLRQLGFSLPIERVTWRPLVATLLMGAILYRANLHSLFSLSVASTVLGGLYLLTVYKLGGFSAVEVGLVREGLGFFRPLLNQWSWRSSGKS